MFSNLSFFSFLILFTFANSLRRTMYENEQCKPGDSKWRCKKIGDCPSAQKAIKAGGRPDICSFDGNSPIVCCLTGSAVASNRPSKRPPQPQPSNTNINLRNSKSKAMCKKYAEYVYRLEVPPILLSQQLEPEKFDTCARLETPLVVGGKDAVLKEFPHMAQIGYGSRSSIDWFCGGSIISERFILSAAHCTNSAISGLAEWARLGDLNVDSDEDDATPLIVRIVERFNHPGYDSVRIYNDIALYKLEKDIKLDEYIRPICLDTGEKTISQAVASGWGHTTWGGQFSNVLQKVSLNLVDSIKCNASYPSSRYLPNGINRNLMICAGDQEGKDTCQGDSGGPLQIAVDDPYCTYSQIGVVSFGSECGSSIPGIYTRVSSYIPWIERIVWP